MQNPLGRVSLQLFFAALESPDPSRPSELSDKAEPSLQISVDLSKPSSAFIKSYRVIQVCNVTNQMDHTVVDAPGPKNHYQLF